MTKNFLALSLAVLAIAGCGFEPMRSQGAITIGSITFANEIPDSIQLKLKNLNTDASNKVSLIIKSYELKERKTYGGSALRALEGEIKGEMEINISDGKNIFIKKLVVVKNFSVNELNPMSERETIKKLEQIIQDQLINQIIFEVQFLEM